MELVYGPLDGEEYEVDEKEFEKGGYFGFNVQIHRDKLEDWKIWVNRIANKTTSKRRVYLYRVEADNRAYYAGWEDRT